MLTTMILVPIRVKHYN